VAKIIATVGGVALKPGVSLNRRWYTKPMIAAMVQSAQPAIESGSAVVRDLDGLTSLTHHAARDDSTRIVGRLKSLTVDEDGNARYQMDLADTPHARTIANLADTSDGQAPFLKGVSIRGAWKGTVRKVTGPDGAPVETADGIELLGLDFTRTPGVPGAGVDTFAWADRLGRTETTERVLITESVEEAHVTITEGTGPAATLAPDPGERMTGLLSVPHILNDGTCLTCEASPPLSKRGSGLKGAGRVWADPGYQADKKQRYDLSSKANAKAAWAYINQPDNAKPYTPAQLKRIKSKIKAALATFGVKVAAESADWVHGWTYDPPVQLSESLAEHYGDPSCAGSWSVNASNGPVNISLSSYSMDPGELDAILRAAADAACKALAALDPDMDGDIDVTGAPGADTDHDGGDGESAGEDDLTETTTPAEETANTGTEAPAMPETNTTPAGQSSPGTDPAALAEAVNAILEQRETARKAAKRERKAREAAAAEAARAATESGAATSGTPATPGATAAETAEQREARIAKLVDEQFAAAAAREGLAAAETDEQMVARMLEERLVPLRQGRAEAGGVQRKGIARLEAIADGSGLDKKLQETTNEELAALAGAAFGPHGARA
jgi:hypothetical protein